MLGYGKKTQAWAQAKRELIPEYQKRGITKCELNYPGCWRTEALGFAHAKKRRNLPPEELKICILACNPCHDKIEGKPDMEQIVMDTIARRRR